MAPEKKKLSSYREQKKSASKKEVRSPKRRRNRPNYWEDSEKHEFLWIDGNRTCKKCGIVDLNEIRFGLTYQKSNPNMVYIPIQQAKYKKGLKKILNWSEWEFRKLYFNPNTPDYKEYYEFFKTLKARFDLPNSFFNEMYFLFSRSQNSDYFKKKKYVTTLIIFYHVMLKRKNFIHLEEMVEIYFENFRSSDTSHNSKLKLFRKHLSVFWQEIDRKPNLEIDDYVIFLCQKLNLNIEIENKCKNLISSISDNKKIRKLGYSGIVTVVMYIILNAENLRITFQEIQQYLNVSKSAFFKYKKTITSVLS